jgi:hypothetical protein
MALTINSQPSSAASMHSDLFFVVSSTNTGQTNFKYVADVYINGNLVTRLKYYPQPSSLKAIINVGNVVRNYWASYFKPTISTPTAFSYIGSDIYVDYIVKFGEEYGGVTYTDLEEVELTAYNFYPDYFRSGVSGGYFGGSSLANLYGTFITNRDKLQLLFDKNKLASQRMFVPYLASEPNTDFNFELQVTVYNGSTSTMYGGAVITDRDYIMIDVSPAAINNYLGTSAITTNTVFYDVEIIEDTISLDYVRVNLDCFPKTESLNLHFLNALGGYDTMLFPLANRQSRVGERKAYSTAEYQYNSSTNNVDRKNQYGVMYGGAVNFWVEQSMSYKLTSNWVNEKDYNWLKELIYSPEVYMEVVSNTFIPVTITDSGWNEKKNYLDKTFNLELNVQLASKVNSQFR